eukprot:CAMPEP_0185559610 /NCGR_PEP_ID=MMETSP1381-20130426/54923_1 /TAXON_ID=298111 /ORGANISM="Pavlova sp., Strain CCMP459" /LENGTH=64 /DNA_ID=CAMNT_0028173237 /DNA_START=361 /DNA_END=552 /DNA_ORIENTATION=-
MSGEHRLDLGARLAPAWGGACARHAMTLAEAHVGLVFRPSGVARDPPDKSALEPSAPCTVKRHV